MHITENGGWTENESHLGYIYFPTLFDIISDIVDDNKPSLVYDFGCGLGHYLKKISEKGIEAVGFEAYPDTSLYDNIRQADLSQPQTLDRQADLVISLEVGEHIPAEFEQTFLDNVCNHTKDVLILSWAIEGQDGYGHVNCRNNDYIIKEVEKRGFEFDESIISLRNNAKDLAWYHDTLMLFYRK